MIANVTIRACGPTAGVVEEELEKAAAALEGPLFPARSNGELVTERNLREPPGSKFHVEGRLKVFFDVSDQRHLGPLDTHPFGCEVIETLEMVGGRKIHVWNVNSDCRILHPMELDP